MTEEQKATCEKLAAVICAPEFDSMMTRAQAMECCKAMYAMTQTPERLMLNPLVKGLVEAAELWIADQEGANIDQRVPLRALAPFKESEKK